jgi:hypothetical protein
VIKNMFGGVSRLPYWSQNMEFDIETWVPYRCDFKPITTNSLFSDALGTIAEMAMRLESELLYMWNDEDCPIGTLVPENLIRPPFEDAGHQGFAIVFSYSEAMEKVLHGMYGSGDLFGAGVTLCGIWKSAILLEECKVLVVASSNPLFDPEAFLDSLGIALSNSEKADGGNVPYFAEKFGFRRFSIPYETDNVTELQISSILMDFEFDETKRFIGPASELSLDNC